MMPIEMLRTLQLNISRHFPYKDVTATEFNNSTVSQIHKLVQIPKFTNSMCVRHSNSELSL